jgi:CubicO group peptidase (beta-lactamase class C family)
VERVSGLSLNGYLHRNIFEPLGLENISMIPTESMKANLAYMNQRGPNGQLSPRDHLLHRPLIVTSDEDVKSCFNSGGAGCFAKPQEYCRKSIPYHCSLLNAHKTLEILAALLNDGTSPFTGKQLLRKETVDEMFRNQIPEFPKFATNGIPPAKADLTNEIPNLYPSSTPQGWGLTFMLTGGATGRSPGTAHWAGLPNLWWWCDREKEIAGIVCSQVLPFADAQVLGLWVDVESAVYQELV